MSSDDDMRDAVLLYAVVLMVILQVLTLLRQ